VFCTNGHAFHSKCLEDHIKSRTEYFYKENTYTKKETKHYTNGIYTGSSWSYNVDVPEKNLPGCPNCREHPPQHHLDITIHDLDTKKHSAFVNVIRNNTKSHQKGFEKVNALYNTFQAGLAGLQQIPEFAPTITTLRTCLIVTDILSGLMTNYYLKENLKKRNRHWLYSIAPRSFSCHSGLFKIAFSFFPKRRSIPLNFQWSLG